MWLAIINFIGGPVVSALISAYKAKLAAGNVDNKIAADLAGAEVAASTSLKTAQIGHPLEPEKLAMYIVLFYMGKVLIYDKCLHLGSTDLINGPVATWVGLIVSFYFGTATIRKMF